MSDNNALIIIIMKMTNKFKFNWYASTSKHNEADSSKRYEVA